jgi:hypothetical protein
MKKTHYWRKDLGALYLIWEFSAIHRFLTFGIGRLEIQVNLWPSEKVE